MKYILFIPGVCNLPGTSSSQGQSKREACCHATNHPLQWRHEREQVKEVAQVWQLVCPLCWSSSRNELPDSQHPLHVLFWCSLSPGDGWAYCRWDHTSRIEGMEAYDAHLRRPVLVVAPVLCAICDNPRASEVVNHMGGAALKFCRMCTVSMNVLKYYMTWIHVLHLLLGWQDTSPSTSRHTTTYCHGFARDHRDQGSANWSCKICSENKVWSKGETQSPSCNTSWPVQVT